jgi:copper chaperone CopZ
MTHTYQVEGMTCGGCVAGVTTKLENVSGVKSVQVNLENKEAIVEMNRHIETSEFQTALGEGKYTIQEKKQAVAPKQTVTSTGMDAEAEESDWQRLYPLFLIFAYLTGTVLLSEFAFGEWNGMRAMQHFMGGFFLIFSFFKLLDLQGFAMSFQMYDPIAKHSKAYGLVYPFIELGLGIGFLIGFNLWLMSLITLIILGIGTIGVARTVLDKKRIQCACLGTVFNLPMTKVTLIENSIMIVMAVGMLVVL